MCTRSGRDEILASSYQAHLLGHFSWITEPCAADDDVFQMNSFRMGGVRDFWHVSFGSIRKFKIYWRFFLNVSLESEKSLQQIKWFFLEPGLKLTKLKAEFK